MKTLDMGFFAILARPFDPVMDWTLFQDGMRFLAGAIGPFAAIGCLAAAVVFSTALLILTAGAVRRLTRLFIQHNAVASRAVVVIAVPWLACALLGTQVVPGVRVAAASTVVYLQHRPAATRPQDRESFAANAAADSFADTPGKELLPGLRGKDVVLTWVESYGRSAIEDPGLAPPVTAVLDAGNRQLRAAGFGSRSGFLTSPTTGGGSWLAHGTLLSGLWLDNQQRYDDFAASHRLTLTSAFRRAHWRTIGVMPGNDGPWPQSESLGYDRIYDAQDMGYHGPRFSWATMPDQYTFLRFEHTEHARGNRPPVMAEITLVSSHAPWEPVPRLIKWGDVGDGFDGMATAEDKPEAILTRDPRTVRKYLADDAECVPPAAPSRLGSQPRLIEPFVELVESWLRTDLRLKASVIHERLVADYGFTGHYQRVKMFTAEARPRIAAELAEQDENPLTGLHPPIRGGARRSGPSRLGR